MSFFLGMRTRSVRVRRDDPRMLNLATETLVRDRQAQLREDAARQRLRRERRYRRHPSPRTRAAHLLIRAGVRLLLSDAYVRSVLGEPAVERGRVEPHGGRR